MGWACRFMKFSDFLYALHYMYERFTHPKPKTSKPNPVSKNPVRAIQGPSKAQGFKLPVGGPRVKGSRVYRV